MQAASNDIHDNVIRFDTDSGLVGIDNRCSACISHKIEDFEGSMQEVNRSIKGFGGTRTYNVKMGTIIWKWTDEDGVQHKFKIPKSYYVPDGKVRLLSPQHWEKYHHNGRKYNENSGSKTLHNKVILF